MAYCICLSVFVLHLEIIALSGWYYTNMIPLLLRRCLGSQIRERAEMLSFFPPSEFLYPSLPYYFVTGRSLSWSGLAVLSVMLFLIFSVEFKWKICVVNNIILLILCGFFYSFNNFMSKLIRRGK